MSQKTKEGKITPKRLQMHIHPELHTMLLEYCFEQRKDMSRYVLDMVAEDLRSKGFEIPQNWTEAPKFWKS